ncbi:MAG: DUF1761 domain-containing protein [Saprospiraceae bacterium]|uniref:DUF1761 domain-containing protein n=1 Tax=Candidatus Opimibacter skivensis TaxID=2982028 RepID=A0A9D7SWP0_9BACT|nr:DUF1761 domain-containing protein [Candidatus Opimibacter skivensis]
MGFIYYHDKVFGKAWMDTLGWTKDSMPKVNMGKVLIICLIMSFLLSMFILINVDGPGQEGKYDSFKHGAGHGIILTFFVAMPLMVINGLFERKNFKYLAIHILYWLITLVLMGGTIDALNHWPADMPAM